MLIRRTVCQLRAADLTTVNQTLLAYPLEALVPSLNPSAPAPRGHQKLSDKHEVQYFACGNISGRTLVIYMRKKGVSGYREHYARIANLTGS